MILQQISSKELICEFFRRHDTPFHLYEIGDLDDFFFPFTTWYALLNNHDDLRLGENTNKEERRTNDSDILVHDIYFIALVYQSPDVTVLLALGDVQYGQSTLELLLPSLPTSFFSHLSNGLIKTITPFYDMIPYGTYLKMVIRNLEHAMSAALQYATSAIRLTCDDLTEIQNFYEKAYPGNWFDPRMLETGQFFGIWDEEYENESKSTTGTGTEKPRRILAAVAGIHVFSPTYQVAALGNIATHPSYRRKGYAKCVTAAVVLSLIAEKIQIIGLNVRQNNTSAIELYHTLGFEELGSYEECMFHQKNTNNSLS